MKWGFTGAQCGAPEEVILEHLKTLLLTENDTVVTGACIGVDTQIFVLVATHWPKVPQLVIIPANRSKVDSRILSFEVPMQIIYMPFGTSYRDRNERLVKESDCITAFWTGEQRSGTNMTKNIAKRAGKLRMVIKI